MIRIYIAGPYTSGDTAVNVRKAIEAADVLMRRGFAPYVPHLTHFWHLLFPHAIEDWYALDLEWLEHCHAVLRLPGDSPGADAEVARATELKIPVYFGMENFPKLTRSVPGAG